MPMGTKQQWAVTAASDAGNRLWGLWSADVAEAASAPEEVAEEARDRLCTHWFVVDHHNNHLPQYT